MRRYDVALAGLGNVGRAFARLLAARAAQLRASHGIELVLAAASDRSAQVVDPAGVPVEELCRFKESGRALAEWPRAAPREPADALRSRGIEGLVDALPTRLEEGGDGLHLARAALDCGLDLVLADKGPLLHALPELEERAAAQRLFLGTSATTGCALPSLAVLRAWFATSPVTSIRGVLNGTTNRILTALRRDGASYAGELARAQADGIAEPDPAFDVEGFDSAVKLVILARGLLDPAVRLAGVERRGITALPGELLAAARRGPERLRLVARAVRSRNATRLSVLPELVEPGDPLHACDGAEKAVAFTSDDLGTLTVLGGASSRTGTAAALLRDLVAAARARR